MQDIFQVGAISSTHGVRGEVKVFPTTDDPKKFKKLKKVMLDSGREKRDLEIESVKFFKNMVILKFKGIDSLNDVEKYKGSTLWVERDQAVPLHEDEYYQADLIGLQVYTEEDEYFGELTDVLETGANDVYEITCEDGKKVLIPAIRECILDVDLEEEEMTIHVMPGLLD